MHVHTKFENKVIKEGIKLLQSVTKLSHSTADFVAAVDVRLAIRISLKAGRTAGGKTDYFLPYITWQLEIMF